MTLKDFVCDSIRNKSTDSLLFILNFQVYKNKIYPLFRSILKVNISVTYIKKKILAESPPKVSITFLNSLVITKMSTKNLTSAIYQIVSDNIIVAESVYNDYLIMNILVILIWWPYSRIGEDMTIYEALFCSKYSKKYTIA